jgi:hypothetical protein
VSETEHQSGGASSGPGRSVVARLVVAFGRFWWEFLVGETPELFVGGVAVVGLTAVLCVDHRLRTAAAFVLPVLVALLLAGSVARAARAARRDP